ncbi:MAG: glycoside hydrolase family 3 C-terminal domain-containing protein [Trebonia sp.]
MPELGMDDAAGPHYRRGPSRRSVLASSAAALALAAIPDVAARAATSTRAGTTARAAAGSSQTPLYLDTRYTFAERAADLVSRMTLAERVAQLQTNSAPAVPRLSLQQYTYWSEALHGILTLGADTNPGTDTGGVHATSFPVNFATTMTWDPSLMYQGTTAISDEARGFLDKSLWGTGQNNLGPSASDYGCLAFYAPNVNMDRDPRWGRTNESFGEDPFLTSTMAGAYINGFQGQSMTGQPLTPYLKAAGTAKHYALNNEEDDRHTGSSDTTDANIRDYYTRQFASLVENARVSAVMTAYNAVNGTRCPADTYTVNELLQRTYGFSGYTTSDCGAIGDIYAAGSHEWAPPHQALAGQIAAQAVVLLQNDTVKGTSLKLLPADPSGLNSVVIVGDLAGTVTLGGYSGDPALQVDAVQGITTAVRAVSSSATVTFDACGTSTTATTPAVISAATQAAIQAADLLIVFVGSDLNVANEGLDRTTLAMPGNYDSLIGQVSAIGNPRTALVIQADGPYDIEDAQPDFPAVVFSSYNGESQGTALAQVLFGQVNPAGHLNFTWYAGDSQLPAIDNYGLTPSQTGGLGRTYMYFTGTPTYPFGYGLSYTTFAYSRVKVGPGRVSANDTVRVSFGVTNTGPVAGATVAQLYVAPKFTVPGVELPRQQLAGFQKTAVLAPGETQHITVTVEVPSLSRWDETSLSGDLDHVQVDIQAARPGVVHGHGGAGLDRLRAELEELTGKPVMLNMVREGPPKERKRIQVGPDLPED